MWGGGVVWVGREGRDGRVEVVVIVVEWCVVNRVGGV